MVRFRGKAGGRPTPVSDRIGAELGIKLESATRVKAQTPFKRAVKTSSASANRRSTRTPSKKDISLSPKHDIQDASLPSQAAFADPKPQRLISKRNKPASHTEILEDQRWDEYSIFDNSLPHLDDTPEAPAPLSKVKSEGDRDSYHADPFGFLQMESEVQDSSSSSLLAHEIVPVRRATRTPPKPTTAPVGGTPERRRSTRLLARPGAHSQGSRILRATNRRLPSIPEKEDLLVNDPKSALALPVTRPRVEDSLQKSSARKKTTKRKKVDGEKLLQEERIRLIEKFKAVDNFKLETRIV